jgi:hypothetical protein
MLSDDAEYIVADDPPDILAIRGDCLTLKDSDFCDL